MWAKDDYVRNLLKRLGECIHSNPGEIEKWKMNLVEAANAALKAVKERPVFWQSLFFACAVTVGMLAIALDKSQPQGSQLRLLVAYE